ncbi:MAG: UbiA family prenyltransferase [Candidatus Aenigmarchaeota archaeon]|nr:UbiA family prenyltransferase [Candidatus Aenigmarchaeota archaeon]
MKTGLSDLLKYIRLDLCIFSTFIASSGYLLNNPLSNKLFFVILSSFFLCAGAYSYNNQKDKEEDLVNRKKSNPYTEISFGKIITLVVFLFGFISCFFLSYFSVMFYIVATITSLIYSKFKMKKYLLVKNIYTGFGVTQVFLIGAANSSITTQIIIYYVVLSVFIMIESIISDLRDYKGDKKMNIRTLPVCFGYDYTKKMLLSVLVSYALFVFFLKLFVLVPFIILMSLYLYKNRVCAAHFVGSLSFLFLMGWLLI